MVVTELGYLLTKWSFWLSLWQAESPRNLQVLGPGGGWGRHFAPKRVGVRGPRVLRPAWSKVFADTVMMTWYIYQFLCMEAKNYKFGMFCQQCHPSMAPGDADIRPEKCLPDLHLPFVYVVILSISPIWRIRETNPSTKSSKILFWIIMPTFGKSCQGPWLHGLKNQS